MTSSAEITQVPTIIMWNTHRFMILPIIITADNRSKRILYIKVCNKNVKVIEIIMTDS